MTLEILQVSAVTFCSPSSNNMQNCKLYAQRMKPHLDALSANQAQALGFTVQSNERNPLRPAVPH